MSKERHFTDTSLHHLPQFDDQREAFYQYNIHHGLTTEERLVPTHHLPRFNDQRETFYR